MAFDVVTLYRMMGKMFPQFIEGRALGEIVAPNPEADRRFIGVVKEPTCYHCGSEWVKRRVKGTELIAWVCHHCTIEADHTPGQTA